jgi:hypothetical protein
LPSDERGVAVLVVNQSRLSGLVDLLRLRVSSQEALAVVKLIEHLVLACTRHALAWQ